MTIQRALLAALLGLPGCVDLAGPDRSDPAAFAFPAPVSFFCGDWVGGEPRVALGLFDIYFSGSEPPTSAQVASIRRRGGTVVHVFNLGRVRAIIRPGAVTAIRPAEARGVTDPTDHTVRVVIGFEGSTGDASAILPHGGRIVAAFRSGENIAVLAVVPDRAIPAIRAHHRVRYVELNLGGCLT